MKKKLMVLLMVVVIAVMPSCSAENMQTETAAQTLTLTPGALTAEYKEKDLDTAWDESAVKIECGDTVKTGGGVKVSEGVIEISDSGTYVLSGEYTGQILINATKEDYVHLVLNGFSIDNPNGSAIFADQCDKLTVTLADGTENKISDGHGYTFAEGEDEPDAALFAKDDMSINGGGSLTVMGNYACGIRTKKDLKLVSGIITVNSVDDAIKAKNSVVVKDGKYTLTSTEGTALKANRDDDATKGYVIIDGGEFIINAGNDGIHSETHTTINGGVIDIQTSEEGIEGQMVDILGGDIKIVSTDDAINAAAIGGSSEPQMPQGGFNGRERMPQDTMSTDGVRPERPQGGFGGRGQIPQRGEMPPQPPQGEMPTDGTRPQPPQGGRGGMRGGMPGGGRNIEQIYISITGGNITAMGGDDVIDSNGNITISGGSVKTYIRNGSIVGVQSIFDCDGMLAVKEGAEFIAVAGGGGNLQTEQNTITVYGTQIYENASIVLKDASETEIISYTPGYAVGAAVITSPKIKTGESYILVLGDETHEITVSEKNTSIGTPINTGRGFGGGMPGGRGKRFLDVDPSSEYYNAVMEMSRRGAMVGTAEGVFSPDEPLTRGAAVTVMGRLAGAENPQRVTFNDVAPDSPYAAHIGWAVDKGIIEGYGNGCFGPDDILTAEQLQLIIKRYSELIGIEFTVDENAGEGAVSRAEYALCMNELFGIKNILPVNAE